MGEWIPVTKRMGEWIPVTERMPEEREWVGTKRFGTTISDEVYVTFETAGGKRFCDHLRFQNGKLSLSKQAEMDAVFKGAFPIAWMPLPELYMADKGNIAIKEMPSVSMDRKAGKWLLVQRGKYVDVRCSECGYSRIEEFAYNYSADDINKQEFDDFIERRRLKFCECCGAFMEGGS